MGKFKVGDKVRYHDENVSGIGVVHGLARDGVYLVNVETKDLDWAYYVKNTCREFDERNLKPVSTWQPKVGDRVRWLGKFKSGMYTEGKVYDIHNSMNSILFVTDDTGSSEHMWNSAAIVDNFELVTPLTIEAGRYYKTRDGRKVGPISRDSQGRRGHWYWQAPYLEGYSANWCENGSFYKSGENRNDLIAEWVDEPAAQPAKASNDNAEPAAKPSFKVGDRVRALNSSFGGAVSAGDVYSVTEVTDYGIRFINKRGRKDGWNAENFELVAAPASTPAIVALIENGTAKPATRTKVHSDQESATTEAERLAIQFPGQQFGVFVLADSKIADVVTETVQRTVLRAA